MNCFTPIFRKQRLRGFTLIEVSLAAAIASILSLGLYAFIQAGTVVGLRSLATSNTGNVARNTVDKIDSLLQVTYDIPVPIQRNGARQTTSGPSAGIRFYRYGGGPYEVDIPSGGLSGQTTTLKIFARKGQSVSSGSTGQGPDAPPAPQPNDVLVINTTILMTGRANQIYAYVDRVTSTSSETRTSSTGRSVPGTVYNISLTDTLTENNGNIPQGAVATVTAVLIRPTAFIVTPNSEGKRELRFYENFPEGTTLDMTSPYTVLTDQVAWNEGGNASSSDAFSTPFVVRKIGDRTFVSTDLRVRNDRYDRFLRNSNRNEFSTFINLKSRVPVKCNPDE